MYKSEQMQKLLDTINNPSNTAELDVFVSHNISKKRIGYVIKCISKQDSRVSVELSDGHLIYKELEKVNLDDILYEEVVHSIIHSKIHVGKLLYCKLEDFKRIIAI
jgi:hypothetical protein